jgi:hypothetical protein
MAAVIIQAKDNDATEESSRLLKENLSHSAVLFC